MKREQLNKNLNLAEGIGNADSALLGEISQTSAFISEEVKKHPNKQTIKKLALLLLKITQMKNLVVGHEQASETIIKSINPDETDGGKKTDFYL